MLAIWNFAHVLTAAVYIAWWGSKVRTEKFAKWWRHTLELYSCFSFFLCTNVPGVGHLPIQLVLHMGHLNSFLELGDRNLTAKNRKVQMPRGVGGITNAWGTLQIDRYIIPITYREKYRISCGASGGLAWTPRRFSARSHGLFGSGPWNLGTSRKAAESSGYRRAACWQLVEFGCATQITPGYGISFAS